MDDFSMDKGMDKKTKERVFGDIMMDKESPRANRKKGSGLMVFLIVVVCLAIVGGGAFLFLKGGTPTGGAVADVSTPKIAVAAQTTTAAVTEKNLASSSDVIKNVLDLRDYSNSANTVKIAETVSWINSEVENYDIAEMKVAWQNIVGCAYQKCEDSAYFNMIDAVSIKQIATGNNDAIHSILETYNLWNGKNQIYFSDSLSKTNKLVIALGNAQASAAWDDLVKCNGQCEDFSAKTLDLVKAVNNIKQ